MCSIGRHRITKCHLSPSEVFDLFCAIFTSFAPPPKFASHLPRAVYFMHTGSLFRFVSNPGMLCGVSE